MARARHGEDGRRTDLESTPQVDSHDLVPHLFVHVDESLVSEDTGIGNEYVNSAESIDGSLDNGVSIFGRADRSDSLTSDYRGVSAMPAGDDDDKRNHD